MNVLDRIVELRTERNWTEYQLAEKSGLTQSTISSWYRKGMLPTLPSLSRICDAFEITLSHFFLEDNECTVVLTPRELHMLNVTDKLDSQQYEALLQFLDTL